MLSNTPNRSVRLPSWMARSAGWLALVALSSCGQIGLQPPPSSVMNFTTGNEGCLNDLGIKVKQYPSGEVDRVEWETAWSCSIDTLKSFQSYVKGSEEEGFSHEDIRALVSKFLITQEPITLDFVEDLFVLKAALLGGNSETLTYQELEQVVKIFGWARDRSSELIPLLAQRMKEQTPESAMQLTMLVSKIAGEFASQLHLLPDTRLSWDLILDLALQTQSILGIEFGTDWTIWLSPVKRILLGGDPQALEADRIPDAIRSLGEIVGAGLPLISGGFDHLQGPNAQAELLWGLGNILRPTIERSLKWNKGTLPLSYFDQVIDLLPQSVFKTPRDMYVDRVLVKKALRIVNWRFLKSGRVSSLDRSGVNRLYDLWGFWTRGKTALDIIFENLGSDEVGVPLQEFVEAAERFAETQDSSRQAEINRLVDISKRFYPIHSGKELMVNFHRWDKYSLGHMVQMHTHRLLAEVIMEGYSTVGDHKKGSRSDINAVLKDWRELLVQLHMLDPLDPNVGPNRFRDANLFTFLSDGDDLADLDETTYLLSFIVSIGTLSDVSIELVNSKCALRDRPMDSYGRYWMDARCFREQYFANVETIWANFPELLKFYQSLGRRDREKVQISLEMGARMLGYSEEPVGMSDLQSFSGLAHYIEALFKRFDVDRTGIIDLEELMRAFPIFKGELARFGNIDPGNTSMLEAVFTYLVRFEAPPVMDFIGTSHFLAWWGWKPFWTIQGDRKSLFTVLSALNPGAKPVGGGFEVSEFDGSGNPSSLKYFSRTRIRSPRGSWRN